MMRPSHKVVKPGAKMTVEAPAIMVNPALERSRFGVSRPLAGSNSPEVPSDSHAG
jgi:hypothetical protein